MGIYYRDQMKAGMMHDRLDCYKVYFYHTVRGHQVQEDILLYIEDGDRDWTKITKALMKRFKLPAVYKVE